MADTKNPSSRNLTSRKPFEPISHTWEIPASLYELKGLAVAGDTARLLPLLDSIISVSGADPRTWVDLPQAQQVQS